MRALFGKSYNEEYKEYVCTDALGNIFKPNYVTTHFPLFLEKNNLKKIVIPKGSIEKFRNLFCERFAMKLYEE